MQKTFLQLMGLLCLSLIFSSAATKKSVANYQVIPLPNEIIVQKNKRIAIAADSKTTFGDDHFLGPENDCELPPNSWTN